MNAALALAALALVILLVVMGTDTDKSSESMRTWVIVLASVLGASAAALMWKAYRNGDLMGLTLNR